jgi:hypothetical protein
MVVIMDRATGTDISEERFRRLLERNKDSVYRMAYACLCDKADVDGEVYPLTER